ncbi:hypothetical protein BZL30_9015 [Mycobacterium kansasii]|uniref:Uncharacterized protein n=1 Tax=Mycobacterium kansasii TaxID=1768 RepID=A0A1V3WCC4_MYCKA|nr:hypothetical protein BZL30_9015 [Mycobacterium kansasii]
MIDEQADARIAFDIGEAPQPLGGFRLRVDGGEDEVPSTAKTTGTRCGMPAGVIVASRATRDCVNAAFGSNSPTCSA